MSGNAKPVDRDLALRLLNDAVAADPAGKAGVARRLGDGFGRSLLSRVLSPNDTATMTEQLARRVIDVYHVIPVCPATGQLQPRRDCIRIGAAPAPTHNPAAMRIWKTCQTCPNKPTGGAK